MMRKRLLQLCIGVLIPMVLVCSCQRNQPNTAANTEVHALNLIVKSTAFKDGGAIPTKYTIDGFNISPPLEWSSAPKNTVSFAIIVDDPNAPSGTFTHWVLFNMPATVTGLPEGMPSIETLGNVAKQGTNDGGKIGYMGPAPPSGTHRYRFKVYALDTKLQLKSGSHVSDLSAAMQGHILAEGMLTGTYTRK